MNVREWALPVYTILMELAAGALLVLWIIRAVGSAKFGREEMDRVVRNPILIILTTIVTSMIGAHFHLSKPYLSFLAVLNFRTSWLSREIIFTLLFFFSTGGLWCLEWFAAGHRSLKTALGWLAISFGCVTVYCMAQIYLLPTQVAWNSPETIISFYSSMLLLGVMALTSILIMDLRFAEVRQPGSSNQRALIVKGAVKWLAIVAAGVLIPVVVLNVTQLLSLRAGNASARTSFELLMKLYQPLLIIRFLALPIGVGWLASSVTRMIRNEKAVKEFMNPAFLGCLLVIIGEILGRFLFYASHIRTGI